MVISASCRIASPRSRLLRTARSAGQDKRSSAKASFLQHGLELQAHLTAPGNVTEASGLGIEGTWRQESLLLNQLVALSLAKQSRA